MWEPKDHEQRVIPIPQKTVQILADLQAESDEDSPYVFINGQRLARILWRRSIGEWTPKKELVNNVLTRLKGFCRKTKITEFCLHDLRRTCITNWAQKLPIQTVKELAGHSSIETTQKYYLSVRQSDMAMAREIQSKLMTSLTNY
jgi:integrase